MRTTAEGSRVPRPWLVAHLASLAGVLAVLVWAGRGQWFFYDEWDFLTPDAEWALLAPHNGHLSFFPQLLTTLIKSVVGLHSYWPYLALVFAAHLLVVHMMWRLMMRCGVRPLIALITAAVFGVLAAGADNTLWAFQVGFVTPLATGIAALLIVWRDVLSTRRVIACTVLLLVGVGFASTGLPMVVAVLIFLACRHGWRATLVPMGAFVLIYGAWYVGFARGSTGSDGFGVASTYDLLVPVPEYVAHAFVDSFARLLPLAALSAVMLVLLGGWLLADLRRSGVRRMSPLPVLALASLGFSFLTAITRVQLGPESASAGRYVYVYAALLLPAAGAALSALCGRSRAAVSTVSVLLAMLGLYNAGGLVHAGRNQAALERSVDRAMSAALTVEGADVADRTPASVVAPTLTLQDVRDFAGSGQYTPIPFEEGDLLSVEVNLLLRTQQVAGGTVPSAASCRLASDGWIPVEESTDLVYAPVGGNVRVLPTRGGSSGQYAQIALMPGWNRLAGLRSDIDVALAVEDGGRLCVVVSDHPVD